MGKPRRVIFLSDVHVPHHSKAYWTLVKKVLKDIGIDLIVLLGDFMDCWDLSRYEKDPAIKSKFIYELEVANCLLDELQAFKIPIWYFEGNHEDRLRRWIIERPQMFGVIDMPKLLRLRERNIRWIKFDPKQATKILNSKLYARHCPATKGEHVAAANAKKSGVSLITGHVHRFQNSYYTFLDRTVKGYSIGFGGNMDSGVFNYIEGHDTWQMGFSIATIDDDGSFTVDDVHIEGNKCLLWGKRYSV